MILDQQAFSSAYCERKLAVFDESKHPRGIGGRWRKVSASTVSRVLADAGHRPLPSGTSRMREGLRVSQSMHRVHVAVDMNSSSTARRRADDVEGALREAGYGVERADESRMYVSHEQLEPKDWTAPPPPVGSQRKGAGGYSSDEAYGTNTALGEDAFTRIVGGRILHPEGKGEQSPIDVQYDGYGFEVKAVSTKTQGYKATPKSYEIEQKEAHAKELGVKAALAIVVVDSENKKAHAYFRDGLKGGRLSKNTGWQYLGSTDVD